MIAIRRLIIPLKKMCRHPEMAAGRGSENSLLLELPEVNALLCKTVSARFLTFGVVTPDRFADDLGRDIPEKSDLSPRNLKYMQALPRSQLCNSLSHDCRGDTSSVKPSPPPSPNWRRS